MTQQDNLKTTAIYPCHRDLGAKLVDFSGWHMPIHYESVLKEHEYVRTGCGIFDVSHMGEFVVKGDSALSYLQNLTINDVSKLAVGGGQYSAILNENGGMIDDLILYRTGENEYFVCVNAANIDKDFAWFKKNCPQDVLLENQSEKWSQIAVQGPNSLECLNACLDQEGQKLASTLAYTHIGKVNISGQQAWLARTGYTGEVGFEIYLPNECAASFFAELAKHAKPIGLGARDTLRLEACYLLYGNDMNEGVSPLEASIGWATKLEKGDFIGRKALLAQKEAGISRRIAAFCLEEKAVPRAGMDIYCGEEKIGTVTSGSVLPSVGGFGGMALIQSEFAKVDTEVEIDIRGKRKIAKIKKKPLYTARVKG